jgi:fructokinase
MSAARYWGIEAGGTKFICAVADDSGAVIDETRIATTTPAETLGAALTFFAAHHGPQHSCAGLGIAAFGPLDLRRDSPGYGHILATPKPQWSHTDLVTPFAQRFGCTVTLDTDVNAAALAEAHFGAGKGCDDLVYVTVGTGIGGGAVVAGKTLHGASHPEMGHIRVRRHALDTGFAGICPFHGDCLEGLASGPALVARYGIPLEQLPATHEAFTIESYYLAQLAVNAILMLAPQRVVFGGGVMENAALLGGIRRASDDLLKGYAGAASAELETIIVAPALGQRAGITGALVLAGSHKANKVCVY